MCDVDLEPHPLGANMMSCYVHGDFEIVLEDGKFFVKWKPIKYGTDEWE